MIYRFEDFVLDTNRRELRRCGDQVHIEPQVFDLLTYLVRHRERVVSKDDLLAAIWNGRYVSESALTTRMNAVRSAINDSGQAQRLIRTLPRKGVRFVGTVQEQPEPEPNNVGSGTAPVPALMPPDRPSVAVLPFVNLSGRPEEDYLADGITEDIITDLSKWRWFLVIARNSSFVFKTRPIDVRQVGRDLGVRYVVEGSVRRSGHRLRITAQLIDATSNTHIWAERFDRDAADLFAVENEVTERLVTAIEPMLARAESFRARQKRTEDLAAWDYYLQGLAAFNRLTVEGNAEAWRFYDEALKRDPNLADAWAGLARVHVARGIHRLDAERDPCLRQAVETAERALAIDDENCTALAALALAEAHLNGGAAALRSARRAVELNANFALGYVNLAACNLFCGYPEDALNAIETALRLSPLDPQKFIRMAVRASALFLLGRYAEAADCAEQSLALQWFHTAARVLAASCAELGQIEKARRAVGHILARRKGDTSIAEVTIPFVRAQDRERYAQALRRAGLPDR